MITEIETKVCTVCGQSKPRTEYYNKGNRLDARCKICVRSQKAKIYKARQRAIKKGWKKGLALTQFNIEFVGQPDLHSLATQLKLSLERE